MLLVVVVVVMHRTATRLPQILGGTVGAAGDPKDRADPQEDAPQHGSQFRLQVEAHQVAHQDVVAGDVGREPRVRHLQQPRHHQQQQRCPRIPMGFALQRQEVIQRLGTDGNQSLLDVLPIAAPTFIAVHLEQNSKDASQRLGFLLEQVRLERSLEAGLPQDVALLVVRVELFGESMALQETVDQLEKVRGVKVAVHALLFALALLGGEGMV